MHELSRARDRDLHAASDRHRDVRRDGEGRAGIGVGRGGHKAILSRTGLPGDQIDQVIVGNALQAGQGMNPGRQTSLKAGIPAGVPAMTIDRVCGSGLQTIVSAAGEVALGQSHIILAGGIENMDFRRSCCPRPTTTIAWACRVAGRSAA